MRGACQDYSTAIKHYTEALEDDEEDVVALLNRSAAYYCMDLFKTSLKDADAALALDNTNAKAWERRGLALQGMGLRGVRALSVGEKAVFAGSVVDEAISYFSRDPETGAMTYQGHILNGERLIERFPSRFEPLPPVTEPEEDVGEEGGWYTGTFPFRVGHGNEWASGARAVTHCSVFGKELFVVLSGDAEVLQTRVFIYEYKQERDVFMKHSELMGIVSAEHVEHFSEPDLRGEDWHYLVVANAYGPSLLYRYNPHYHRFFLFNEIPQHLPDGTLLPPQCATAQRKEQLDSCNPDQSFKLPNVEARVPPWRGYRSQGRARKVRLYA